MRIRPARGDDREFVLGLAPRLTAFGAVPERDPLEMAARDRDVLKNALEKPASNSAVFVAEDDGGRPIGFIHLTTAEDYYSNSNTGHVADIVVAPAASGYGVGSALLAYAEEWARARGFAMLTLNVFTANHRARQLYTRLGFREEWIRCIKRL